jgi:hypothetical protein
MRFVNRIDRRLFKLRQGPIIPPPHYHRLGEKKSDDWGDHPEDMTYASDEPPEGVCKNRYCPHTRNESLGNELVRGYCSPCASIRRSPERNDDHVVDRSKLGWGSMADIVTGLIR